MKAITEKETLNNRFCKFDKATGKVEITTLTREQAMKMNLRTLCLYVASSGLKFRDVTKATANANTWLKKTKEELLNVFFPEVTRQKSTDSDFEKVAICKTPEGTTYGYIYTKNGWFGYYMCGATQPEKKGTLEEVESYVRKEWNLEIKRYAKFKDNNQVAESCHNTQKIMKTNVETTAIEKLRQVCIENFGDILDEYYTRKVTERVAKNITRKLEVFAADIRKPKVAIHPVTETESFDSFTLDLNGETYIFSGDDDEYYLKPAKKSRKKTSAPVETKEAPAKLMKKEAPKTKAPKLAPSVDYVYSLVRPLPTLKEDVPAMEEITKVWNVIVMSCSDELLFQMLNAATIPNVKFDRLTELSRILSGKQKDRSQLRVLANLLTFDIAGAISGNVAMYTDKALKTVARFVLSVPYRTANVTAYLGERGFKLVGNVYKNGRKVLNTYEEIAAFINANK